MYAMHDMNAMNAMHVYMCTCVHVYMCTCVHVYMFVCVCVGVYVQVFGCAHVSAHVGISVSAKAESENVGNEYFPLFCFQVHVEFIEDKDKILIQGPPAEVQSAENLLSSSLMELVC